MRKITKRSAAIATAAVVAVGGLGATAWAAGWFNSSASATVRTASAGTITAQISFTNPLYPTGTTPVTASVTNPNPYAVRITSVALGAFTGAPTGCTVGNAGISVTPGATVVIPKDTDSAISIPLGNATMAEWADGACAGGTSGFAAAATLDGVVAPS